MKPEPFKSETQGTQRSIEELIEHGVTVGELRGYAEWLMMCAAYIEKNNITQYSHLIEQEEVK